MKHLFLLFLLIPVTLFAQVDKKYLAGAVPVVDDRVVFTEELNLPGRSQNDIFATLLQWATTRFITTEELQSRILYSDQDKGQIACMGQEYLVFTNKALSLDRAVINYQMFITCKPGKCELKVTAIRYQYNRGTAGQEIIPAEEQITDQHTLNKTQTKLIKSTGKFRIHTIDLVDKLFADAAAAVGATQVSAPVATQTPAVPRVPVTSTTVQAPDNTITPANLEGYRQISPDKIPGNIYKMLSENWMLITAGNDAQYNMMTASWGGLGHMYNKPVAFCFINYCGTNSGRDKDKVKEAGLTPITTPSGSKAFSEAWMIIECRKMVSQSLIPEALHDSQAKEKWGTQLHKMYIGEILNVWVK